MIVHEKTAKGAAKNAISAHRFHFLMAAVPVGIGEKLTVGLVTGQDRFDEINAAYGGFFGGEPPARVAVGVAALPKGARVEIEATVAIE